jgi:hypothetical protein
MEFMQFRPFGGVERGLFAVRSIDAPMDPCRTDPSVVEDDYRFG